MKYVPVVPREYWPELRGQVGAVAVAEPAAEDTDYIVVDIVAVVVYTVVQPIGSIPLMVHVVVVVAYARYYSRCGFDSLVS